MKAMLDSLDGMSEEMAKEYKPGEGDNAGKFVLDVEGAGGLVLENVTKLKSALSQERANAQTSAKKLELFAGIEDPAGALDAIKKVKEYANFDPDQKIAEGIKAQKDELISRHKVEKSALLANNKRITGQLENVLVQGAVLKALVEEKGNVELMLPHVQKFVRMRDTDGGYVAEVIDEQGNPKIGDTEANPLTIPQLVQEFKANPQFAAAFEGTGASGSGATGGGKGGNVKPGGHPRTIDASDQQALNNNIEAIAKGDVLVEGF